MIMIILAAVLITFSTIWALLRWGAWRWWHYLLIVALCVLLWGPALTVGPCVTRALMASVYPDPADGKIEMLYISICGLVLLTVAPATIAVGLVTNSAQALRCMLATLS